MLKVVPSNIGFFHFVLTLTVGNHLLIIIVENFEFLCRQISVMLYVLLYCSWEGVTPCSKPNPLVVICDMHSVI